MKTIEQVMQYPGGSACNMLDGRDRSRLVDFAPTLADIKGLRFELKDEAVHEPEPFTEENVRNHLLSDLEFAFDKARNQRGISSNLMFEVIRMWMWVLEDPLYDEHEHYDDYGISFYKAVAAKYKPVAAVA